MINRKEALKKATYKGEVIMKAVIIGSYVLLVIAFIYSLLIVIIGGTVADYLINIILFLMPIAVTVVVDPRNKTKNR